MNVVLVGLGGFFGAIARFALGEWLHTENGFPLGTLSVNLVGCFVLGWFLMFAKLKGLKSETTLLVGTGFIGSFTTFSTFSLETVHLIENGQISYAILYVLASIFAGILFAYIGYKLARKQKLEGKNV